MFGFVTIITTFMWRCEKPRLPPAKWAFSVSGVRHGSQYRSYHDSCLLLCSALQSPRFFFFYRCIHHNKQQMQRDGCPQQDGALISVHREAPSDSFISLSATCCRLATNVPYNHNWPSQSASRLGLGQMACSTMKNVPKFDTDKRTSSLPLCLLIFSHVRPASANATEPSEIVHNIKSVMCYDSQIIGLS